MAPTEIRDYSCMNLDLESKINWHHWIIKVLGTVLDDSFSGVIVLKKKQILNIGLITEK